MEAAKADGYTTGLVVTSRITHASESEEREDRSE